MKTRLLHGHDEAGFSLVELVVVIGIVGILLTIGTINFNQWLIKNRVEAQVRQMATDFSELRVRAFTTKQTHRITVNVSSYIFKSYSSESDGGTIIPSGMHTVQFPLKTSTGADFDGTFEFDPRGMSMGNVNSIFLDSQNASPALDCLKIHTIRINPGKKNGSNCDDK